MSKKIDLDDYKNENKDLFDGYDATIKMILILVLLMVFMSLMFMSLVVWATNCT